MSSSRGEREGHHRDHDHQRQAQPCACHLQRDGPRLDAAAISLRHGACAEPPPPLCIQHGEHHQVHHDDDEGDDDAPRQVEVRGRVQLWAVVHHDRGQWGRCRRLGRRGLPTREGDGVKCVSRPRGCGAHRWKLTPAASVWRGSLRCAQGCARDESMHALCTTASSTSK